MLEQSVVLLFISEFKRSADYYLKISQAAKLSYSISIIKSVLYGVFVAFVVWKLQVCCKLLQYSL